MSWLFAAPAMQAPLLGIYALNAEWQALRDASTERSVTALKLAWWVEEMQRLQAGAGAHPISRYLRALDRAQDVDFTPLRLAAAAAAFDASGAPLERAVDLLPHADALWGGPMRLAAQLGGESAAATSTLACTRNLAGADYLLLALEDYVPLARQGRIPFIVEQLLHAGIETEDLTAPSPSPPLSAYLQAVRRQAADYYAAAYASVPASSRRGQRHLLILASLGQRAAMRLQPTRWQRFTDVLLSWRIARRASLEPP